MSRSRYRCPGGRGGDGAQQGPTREQGQEHWHGQEEEVVVVVEANSGVNSAQERGCLQYHAVQAGRRGQRQPGGCVPLLAQPPARACSARAPPHMLHTSRRPTHAVAHIRCPHTQTHTESHPPPHPTPPTPTHTLPPPPHTHTRCRPPPTHTHTHAHPPTCAGYMAGGPPSSAKAGQ